MINPADYINYLVQGENIEISFQPIVSVRKAQIVGYEVFLVNPFENGFIDLRFLLQMASAKDLSTKIDRLVIKKIKDTVSANTEIFENKKIFINICAYSIVDSNFISFVTSSEVFSSSRAKNIVFELNISDCETIELKEISNSVKILKSYGYSISAENIGRLNFLTEFISAVKPAYIKIGREVYCNIAMDSIKSRYLASFLEFCEDSRIKVIATMIEKMEELISILEAGIEYLQGFYIMPPKVQPQRSVPSEIKEILIETVERQKKHYFLSISNIQVKSLCVKIPELSPDAMCEEALDLFEKNPKLHGIVVTDNGKVAGMIKREKFLLSLSTMYGYAMYSRRPVALLMDTNPIVVEPTAPIYEVVKEISARDSEDIHDYIIVAKDGIYEGIVTIKDLLKKVTQLEVSFAKHLNPLTALAGNLLIEREIDAAIERAKPFFVCYIDIDNFKPFNDYYGFEKGDKVILNLSRILKEVKAQWEKEIFIGHIGGDDFVVVIYNPDIVEDAVQKIIEKFENTKTFFYTHEDLQKGYIESKNRKGEVERYELMSLSVAVVKVAPGVFKSAEEISNQLSKIKKTCKQKNGSCYIIWDGEK